MPAVALWIEDVRMTDGEHAARATTCTIDRHGRCVSREVCDHRLEAAHHQLSLQYDARLVVARRIEKEHQVSLVDFPPRVVRDVGAAERTPPRAHLRQEGPQLEPVPQRSRRELAVRHLLRHGARRFRNDMKRL